MDNVLPKNFDEFVDARKEGFLRALEVKQKGGRIAGCLCTYTPQEILDAADIVSVGICGTSNETIPEAEAVLPKNLCPLIKSTYGFAITEKCPYTYFSDIIIGETTCDGKKKMYELLERKKDVHILHLPQGKDRPYTKEMWYQECKLMKERLEEKFGIEITDEKLREAVRKRNELRRLNVEMYNLQTTVPPMIKGSEIMLAMMKGEFALDIDSRIENVRNIIKKAKEDYANGIRPVSENMKRILLTGCPSGGVFQKLTMAIENAGGVIVCKDDCGGERTQSHYVDENAEDILRAISDRYMEVNCSVFTPNDARMENTMEMIDKYKVEGVVELILQACHTFNIEAVKMEEAVKSKGIPYIKIETDYSETDIGQLNTRIAAFMEMI